jgi:Ribosome recycling factor
MIQQSLDTATEKMDKAVTATKEEFAHTQWRAGQFLRCFSKVMVDYYGHHHSPGACSMPETAKTGTAS